MPRGARGCGRVCSDRRPCPQDRPLTATITGPWWCLRRCPRVGRAPWAGGTFSEPPFSCPQAGVLFSALLIIKGQARQAARCRDLPVLAQASRQKPRKAGGAIAASRNPGRRRHLPPSLLGGHKEKQGLSVQGLDIAEEGGHAASSDPVGWIHSMGPGEKSLLPSPFPAAPPPRRGGMLPGRPAEGHDGSSPAALFYHLDHSGMFSANRTKPN